MTGAERRLWRRLRELNRMLGTHFRRQAPLGPYIADFAELGRRVVIEVDAAGPGGVHAAEPDAWFATQGFSVVRFRTPEVEGNLEGVMQAILDMLERTSAEGSPPTPSLPREGGGRRRRRAVAHHGGTR
jgi:very-short-patch-repair endonuclease